MESQGCNPRRCHSVSPERAKRISIAVLPVMDVNQLTKNSVPDILGGWSTFALDRPDDSRIRGTRRLPPCLTKEARSFGDRYNAEWSKEGKNGCTCLLFSVWSRPTGGLGSTDEFESQVHLLCPEIKCESTNHFPATLPHHNLADRPTQGTELEQLFQ